MIPEIGQFALTMGLMMALIQSLLPLLGAHLRTRSFIAAGIAAARVQSLFILTALLALIASFVNHDFSVRYVAEHSNTDLPLYYRIAATWGAHEGSMLLWASILSLWTLAITWFTHNLEPIFKARVLSVMGMISFGILSFIIMTSDPFERIVPIPPDGRDLNPLLQDIGMTIHPPMLYMGYVGLSVAFSFAIAALMSGQLDSAWARWSRPWTLLAWVFLTFGIVLGSWWAYYELGWGGWWFWDPVENASFMPWLVATALIHSLAATEKRGVFKAWTILLALFAFSLSLLGTFLVRSGVLTSVHAFASDPARGLFILIFLGIVVGGSLLLYGLRAGQIKEHTTYEFSSRESLLLLNNLVLVCSAASILLGTLYPLVLDALNLGKISVGAPYFASVFSPLMLPVYLFAGFAPLVPWKKASLGKIIKKLWPLSIIAACLGLIATLSFWNIHDIKTTAGLSLSAWLILTALFPFGRIITGTQSLATIKDLSPSVLGMTLAHLGIGVFLVGVLLSSAYSEEKIIKMSPGEVTTLAGYNFQFDGVSPVNGPNYRAQEGRFLVNPGEHEILLKTQKRIYQTQKNPMTEAAIDPGLTRDLYVALGDPMEGGAWSVRLYYKPFIRWVWLGGLLMMLGGLFSISDRRYRIAPHHTVPVTQG
mgnify:CR=1 FL=1